MRIAICDDDPSLHSELIHLLHEYKLGKHIDFYIDTYKSGYDLLKKNINYDIIFMDYQMDGLDGIETCWKIREINKECIIIFISAYPEAALDSFEVGTFRFLRKPVNENKLFKALNDYRRSIDYDNLLVLNTHDRSWKIKMSDIVYAEAKGKYTIVRTVDRSLEIHIHLKVIEGKLSKDKFIRCQRAYVAGFEHIKNHTNNEIIFDNGEKAQIGRAYYSKFKEAFRQYITRYNEQLL